ncbi:MAG: alkaline phosphatase family protein [Planctomycetes bacterium]|nr:alkaline phosphatase family protein [Planctomycetota bacterium]
MTQRLARKLLVVGWDAADWKIIDPLMVMGRLPTLKALIDSGVRADLRTLEPRLSPLLWTSIATGKRADKHGILNFVEPDPAGTGLRLSTSTSRKCKALWNILSQSGIRTNVVGWYATHPAEPVLGTVVSNLLFEGVPRQSPGSDADWPLPPQTVHPDALREAISDLRLHPAEVARAELGAFGAAIESLPDSDPRPALMQKLLAQAASVQNIATWLLDPETKYEGVLPAEVTFVFNEAVDVFGHHFMQYRAPKMPHVSDADHEVYRHVMEGIYQVQDMMLARLLELSGPETTVIVLSDHGFHSDHLRPAVSPSVNDEHAAMDATWHRELGILVMAGPGIARAATLHGPTLLDIAPTILTLLGLPIGADMDGRPLIEALSEPVTPDRVFSWDDLPGESGMHPPGARVDPLEATQALKQLVDLGYLASLPGTVEEQYALVERESKFNLAIVQMSAGRIVPAAEILQGLNASHPGEPRYAINLAQCLYQLARFADGRAVLEALLRHHPDLPDAKVFLGAALIAEGKPEQALAHLEAAQSHASVAPERDCLIGRAYALMRQPDKAESAYARAAHADPHNPKAHAGLATVALIRGRFDAAAEHAFQAVQVQHFFPEGHFLLGQALTWMKQFDQAVQFLNIAVSMQPGYLDAHRFLASIHRSRGDVDNARKHRLAAEEIMARAKMGDAAQFDPLAEAPMGPMEWERRSGQ